MNRLSIIIPCFNESATIVEIVNRILQVKLPLEKEIVIVDDASTDDTSAILRSKVAPLVSYIAHHTKNQGKGAAISTGLKHITGDIVIIQDADLEYNPNDYLKLIQPILDGNADVVYGSRFLTTDARRALYFWHDIGNRFLTLLSNLFSNLNLTDMETCYKALNKKIYSQLHIKERRFGVEPEITAKVAKLNARIYEVGISYYGRTYQEGKKVTWRDGVMAVYYIIKYNLFTGL